MASVTLHLLFSGRVQGVGFRRFLWKKAQETGVHGWVKNLPDGTVEAWVQGEADAVNRFILWGERGPFGASPVLSEKEQHIGTETFTSFDIRY
jgi:acylphosphatase